MFSMMIRHRTRCIATLAFLLASSATQCAVAGQEMRHLSPSPATPSPSAAGEVAALTIAPGGTGVGEVLDTSEHDEPMNAVFLAIQNDEQLSGTPWSKAISGETIGAADVPGLCGGHNGPLFPEPVFATSTIPNSVAIGDLDGDSRPDLAVSSSYSDKIGVLRNLGNGRFADRVDFDAGGSTISVVISDLDGDGRPDLAAANWSYISDRITVLRNTSGSGNMSFAAPVQYATGLRPQSVAIGDLDGDGRPDLAVANSGSDTVSVLRNISGGGTIGFGNQVNFATGRTPTSVAIGDLDGDARPDLALSNWNSNSISVMRNTSEGGNLAFASRVDHATSSNPASVVMGDLDGDARPELVFANYLTNIVSVLRNLGNAAFDAPMHFATGTNPRSIVIRDLDDDGRRDLAVVNSHFSSGSGGGTISILRNMSAAGSVALADRVDFASAPDPFSCAIDDLDGDTRPDLAVVTISSSSAGGNTVSVLRNLGNGAFAARADYATDTAPSSLAIGDVDGDARPDLAVANYYSDTVSVRRNLGNGTFAARVEYATGTAPTSVAIGDLDNDGRPDLAVANLEGGTVSVLRNTSGSGNLSFANRVDYAAGTDPNSVTIGDLNGDGRPDLAISNISSDTVSVLRNTSGGGNLSFGNRTMYGTGFGPSSVAMGDLDGDGRPDLAVTNNNGNTVSVLRNTSEGGNLALAQRVDYAIGLGPRSIAIGDLNADGRPDLAVANTDTGYVGVLQNLGNGTFGASVFYATGSLVYSVVIGDLDADGYPDLAAANNYVNTLSVLRNLGNGTFATRVNFATGIQPVAVAVGDLNSDGHPDLAVANIESRTVSVLLNQSVSPTPCPGDSDGNCSVTFIDITTVLANFGNDYGPPPATGPGDADLSGAVTFLDITTVLANFGAACGS